MQRDFRETIQARLRHPGGLHEWLLVCRADLIKAWGISFADYAAARTPIRAVRFISPDSTHGGPGSACAHLELASLMANATSLESYAGALCRWAENRLQGGAAALPRGLRATARDAVVANPVISGVRGEVSLFAGNFGTPTALDDYLHESAFDHDDTPPSRFAADLGVLWYDHDLLEAIGPGDDTPMVDRVRSLSFASSFAVAMEAAAVASAGDSVIALYDHDYSHRCPVGRGQGAVRHLGTFAYASDR